MTAFFGGEVSRTAKTKVIGVLLALYPLGQFIGSPVIGALSNKFGRKWVITVSLFFTTAFYLLIALSLEFHLLWLLMAACFMCGLTESNIAIAQSSVADISLPEERGVCSLIRTPPKAWAILPVLFLEGSSRYISATPPSFWIVMGLLVLTYLWVIFSFKDPYKPNRDVPINYFKTFTNLATMAVKRPLSGVTPLAIANAIARGSATMPTVTPAKRSCVNMDLL